jgi:collagen type III alpha
MATLLDAPKPTAKIEEFVERQLTAARRRVRVLDFFLVGLALAAGSLAFLLVCLLVNRYVEMPRGTWWVVAVGYTGIAIASIYAGLFRGSRRDINPYYAARQVEQTVPDAKNSLVTFVDFEEDEKLPGSIRSAISQKAARDLRKVDLNRAIENRRILWLGIAAGIFGLAAAVVAFLPATRTELTLEQPKDGDITVFNNQEVNFQVHVHGRIPNPNAADAVRLRMWYNPDDPETYEDRPLRPTETDRREFTLAVPPKQVRNGFHYRILAGKTQTPEYTVTSKIVPEFKDIEVGYVYPDYLKRAAERSNDSNLLAPYGTIATLTITANREVKSGYVEVEGSPRTFEGQPIDGRPDAMQFVVPMEKDGYFSIHITTPEGDKNQNPARLKMTVIDPKPTFRSFDLAYDYPAYLRFKPMTAVDVREPEIEALRGTHVVLTAKTTRGVRDAKLEWPGLPTVIGEPVPDQPMWVRFKLPALDKDATARVTFTPSTAEGPSATREIPVRALVDQAPAVEIKDPADDVIHLPANGTLAITGLATDDQGVDKLTLWMKVVGSEERDLKPKPYRNGMSFFRKDDNSWPTRVEYKDFVKLPELRMEKEPNWRATAGTKIEYWLEAVDNCAVPPGPNRGKSNVKTLIVDAPKIEEQKKIEQRNQKLNQDQQQHEKKQDQANQAEKRDVKQERPKGAQDDPQKANPDQANPPQPKDGNPQAQPPDANRMNMGEAQPGMNPPNGNPQDDMNQQVQKAIQKAEDEQKNGGTAKPGPNSDPAAKVDPGESRPEPPKGGPMDPPPGGDHAPKSDPNMNPMGEPGAGAARGGNVDKTKEDKGDVKDAGMPPPEGASAEKGDNKPSYGGGKDDAAAPKPDVKDSTPPTPGMPPKEQVTKGDSHPEPKKTPDAKDPTGGTQTAKGGTKPEKEVTPSDAKRGSSEPGPMGDKPPSDVATEKPKDAPPPGDTKKEPKKDQTAEAGGARGGPMDEGAAGQQRPQPKKADGTKDETAKGDTKGGPGAPPNDPQSKPGELSREQGELAREINSSKPEVSDKVQDDVDRLMRNPETREQTRKDLDKLERNAKDELSRKKAQNLRDRGEQAAKNYDEERPTPEKVDELAKKANSNNPQDQRDAEQRTKDWEKDPAKKKELEEKVDELAKKDPKAAERIKEQMKKAEQERQQAANSGEQPKMDDKDLQKMAKDLNGSDPDAKAKAAKQLDKMMQDPKTRQQAQDKLNDMANKAQGQDKQDLQNAAKQAGDKADEIAKQQGTKPDQKLDPKDLQAAADKMASKDPKTQQEGKDQLEKLTRDPKAAAEAQKQLQEMANNAKTPEEKQALQDAANKAGDLAKNNPPPKLDPEALKNAADKLAKGDEKAKQQAKEDLERLMKNPEAAKEAQKQLDEMAKNAKTPEEKKALQDAANKAGELAKNNPPKDGPKPEDLKDIADKLAGKDEQAKKEAEKKLQDMMNDPKTRDEAMKQLQEMAKNAKPEDKKALEDAANKANEMAKNQPPKLDPKDLQDIAKNLKNMDPKAKEELRKQMDETMKDPKKREEMKKAAEEMAKKPKTPAEQKQFDDFMNQMAGNWPEFVSKPDQADPRNKLKSAELMLEKFKKLTPDQIREMKWTPEQEAQWLKDQEALITQLRKQAEKGDWRTNQGTRSPVGGGPTAVKQDPKSGNDALGGARYAPPSGYVDPYKKFTSDQPGAKTAEPKR